MTLTTTNIDELLEQCRLGDQRAQMTVYNKYYKAMYNASLRIVKHPTEAEDVMQEAFLKAFSKLDSFKGDSTFGAWLKRIVVNHSINSFKKRSKQQEVSYEDQLKYTEDDGEGYGVLEEQSSFNAKIRFILNTLDSLKENYRVILTLHLIEGYDHEEICQILSISHANCRTTISRAKESLRKKMMSYEK